MKLTKTMTFLLILTISISFCACDKKAAELPAAVTTEKESAAATTEMEVPETTEKVPITEATVEETEEVEMEAAAALATVELHRVTISIAGAELTEYDGIPMLRVYYDSTNNSPTDLVSPLYGSDSERIAYQNGEELEGNIRRLDDVTDYMFYNNLLYPGVTVRACENFELLDTTSPVAIHIGNDDNSPLSYEFDLSDLPEPGPAPQKVLIPKPEGPETWEGYMGTSAEFSSDYDGFEFKFSLEDVEIVDFEGEKYLRAYFEFSLITPEDDSETMSAVGGTTHLFFQDGIQLDEREESPLPLPDDVDKANISIKAGESYRYVRDIRIVSDSDIIVTGAAFHSYIEHGDPFIGEIVSVK